MPEEATCDREPFEGIFQDFIGGVDILEEFFGSDLEVGDFAGYIHMIILKLSTISHYRSHDSLE